MFGDGLFAALPISFPRLMENTLWQSGVGGDLLEDQVMELQEPWGNSDLVLGPRAWVRPRPRWCPHMCMASRPRRCTRRHFVILPSLASDDEAMPSGGRRCGRGAPADSPKTKGKDSATDMNFTPSRKQAACTCSGSSENFTNGKWQDSGSSVSSEGCRRGARSVTGCHSSSSTSFTDAGYGRGESPWQFSVDMSGCDEVRAVTEGGMLMVEGRGSSDSFHKMKRYVTPLPRHVTHDSLTARLSNGCLTVTQTPGAQHLEEQARTLRIEMQQHQEKAPEAKEHKEQQKTPESTEQNQQRVLGTTAQQQKKASEGNNQQKSQASGPKQTPNLPACVEREQSHQATAA